MKSIIEVLQVGAKKLEEKKIPSARFIMEQILTHVLQISRVELYLQFDRPLGEEELESIRVLFARAIKQEPLAYILGKVDFYHSSFLVNPAVLIPRLETELLVEKLLQHLEKNPSICKVWDVCTGSGCIGISLKKEIPSLQVSVSDISSAALQVAKENAYVNSVELFFFQGDLLEPFKGEKADLIVSNPPYVSQKEWDCLDPSVKDYEPPQALIGGERGVEYYERLASQAPLFLQPEGWLFLEIGYAQREEVSKIFSSSLWRKGCVEKDYAGKDRFFSVQYSPTKLLVS